MAGRERNNDMAVRKSVFVGDSEWIDAEVVILVIVAMRVAVVNCVMIGGGHCLSDIGRDDKHDQYRRHNRGDDSNATDGAQAERHLPKSDIRVFYQQNKVKSRAAAIITLSWSANTWKTRSLQHLGPGVPLALGSAFLFGATAPASKILLNDAAPQLLAGVRYVGAGAGPAIRVSRKVFGAPTLEAPLRAPDIYTVAGATER